MHLQIDSKVGVLAVSRIDRAGQIKHQTPLITCSEDLTEQLVRSRLPGVEVDCRWETGVLGGESGRSDGVSDEVVRSQGLPPT